MCRRVAIAVRWRLIEGKTPAPTSVTLHGRLTCQHCNSVNGNLAIKQQRSLMNVPVRGTSSFCHATQRSCEFDRGIALGSKHWPTLSVCALTNDDSNLTFPSQFTRRVSFVFANGPVAAVPSYNRNKTPSTFNVPAGLVSCRLKRAIFYTGACR